MRMTEEEHASSQPSPPDDADATEGRPARRLTRSRRPKVVGGVCVGLGRYFDLDPVVFRVPLVILSVVGGLGLVFYGFAWLLIPAEDERQNEARWLLSGRVEGTTLSAILVALVGCGLFLASLGSRSTPFSLLIAGAVVGAAYWSQHRRQAEAAEAVGAPVDPTTAHAVADAPPEAQAPPVPGMPSWWREPLTKDGVHDTGYLWGPEDAELPGGRRGLAGDGSGVTGEGASPWAYRTGRRARTERRGRPIGGLVAVLASAAALIGTFAGWNSQPLGTSLTLGLACALGVYAIGLVVSAFVGRVGFGTVFLVIVTAVLLGGASVIPKSIGTDWRDVTWTPVSASDVDRSYRLDAGRGELDLREARFGKDSDPVRTTLRVGAGQLKVVVPQDTRIELKANVGAGEIRLPKGRTPAGGAVVDSYNGLDRRLRETLKPFDGEKAGGTLELSVHVDVGQFEIVRVLPSGERSDRIPTVDEPRRDQWDDR